MFKLKKSFKKFINSKRFRRIGIIVLAFLVGILVGGKILINKVINPYQDNSYLVQRVIDGDTLVLKNGQQIRLLGINAPEANQCYFEQSKKALQDLVANQQVRLEKDISGADKYDRLLRYLILPAQNPDKDDILVNDYLIRNGFGLAEPYPPDVRYRTLFYSAEQVAREGNLGLWAVCNYTTYLERTQELDTPPPSDDCLIKGNISHKGYGQVYFFSWLS